MKATILFSALIMLAACGRVETPKTFKVNRRFEPIVASNEVISRLSSICNQLSQKAVLLDRSLGRTFDMTFAEKKCEDSLTGAATNVTVTAQKENNDYVFKQGSSFFQFQLILNHLKYFGLIFLK